jgi:hypothetical protein
MWRQPPFRLSRRGEARRTSTQLLSGWFLSDQKLRGV